jgi:AcrR family transcriptional regulator
MILSGWHNLAAIQSEAAPRLRPYRRLRPGYDAPTEVALTSPKPLRADARRNRDRLIEVATAAFATDGLAVPLDEIARRAGVGPGTVYRHFPTKESLFEAVVQHRLAALTGQARALGSAADAGPALLEFIDLLVREAAPKRDLVDALTSAGLQVGPAVLATARELQDEIGRLLRGAQRQGAIRGDLGTDELMALISGMLVALQPGGTRHPDPELVLAVIRDGLRAPAARPLAR